MSNKIIYLIVWKDEADYRFTYHAFYDKNNAIKFMIKEYQKTYGFDEIPEGQLTDSERLDLVNQKNIFPPSQNEYGMGYYYLKEIAIQ